MTAQSGPGVSLAPSLDYCTTAPQATLGMEVEGIDGKRYRYVQFLDAIPYLPGHLCTAASGGDGKVTNDRAGGSALAGHEPAGVVFQAAANVPLQNQYGYVQTAGLATVLGTYAIGDQLKPHATVDGTAVVSGYTAAAVDFNICGHARSTTQVRLKGME